MKSLTGWTKHTLSFATILLLPLFPGCLQENTSVDFSDALSELHAAIDYKAKECGNRPANLLIPPKHVEQHALRLCSISIIRLTCPFNEYPLFCTEMFFHLPGAPQ